MRKILSILLAVILVVGCFTLTGCDCKHEWDKKTGLCTKCGLSCQHTFDNKGKCSICRYACLHENHDSFTRECKDCGGDAVHTFTNYVCTGCGVKTQFLNDTIPLEYEKVSGKKGTIVTFIYDTYAYAIEDIAKVNKGTIAIEKIAKVYLPYGYDENKQYNVLYLMHGGGDTYDTWFELNKTAQEKAQEEFNNVNMIDNVFANGEVEPFIIVTPSFYSPAPEGSAFAEYNEAEDIGTYQIRNFRFEMKDLAKAFESTYLTYANKDVSDENLIATRGHRAYSGLSMGARTSFASIMSGCLDFIGYIGSFSGSNVTAGGDDPKLSIEWMKKALNETFPNYDILYWYHGEGTDDMRYKAHSEVYYNLLKEFPNKLKEYENTEFVVKKDFFHDMKNWHIDLYNVMHVFFTK